MKKIVINDCYGGFGISHEGVMRYAEIKGITLYPWLGDFTKDVYGECAVIGNDDLLHHYSQSPVIDGVYREDDYFSPYQIGRDDPVLIRVVEEMGKSASGRCSSLRIVQIPDDVDYTIEEYDGIEWVAEKHRRWN